MIITYHGKEFFKITQGDLTIAYNPLNKGASSGIKPTKFGSDIVLLAAYGPDYDGVDFVTYGERQPFVIDGPGEYEKNDIFFRGFLNAKPGEPVVTSYFFVLDGIRIGMLGPIESMESISNHMREEVEAVDVLFVPVGGVTVLDPVKAHTLAMSFGPSIIIPMDYGAGQDKDSLKKFLKQSGAEKLAPVEKLTLKKKDLEGKDGDIVVMDVV